MAQPADNLVERNIRRHAKRSANKIFRILEDVLPQITRDEFRHIVQRHLEAGYEIQAKGLHSALDGQAKAIAALRKERGELRDCISRAIAHANKYRHPGTNAGDHKVLSEMVSILEGKGG